MLPPFLGDLLFFSWISVSIEIDILVQLSSDRYMLIFRAVSICYNICTRYIHEICIFSTELIEISFDTLNISILMSLKLYSKEKECQKGEKEIMLMQYNNNGQWKLKKQELGPKYCEVVN